ncbi:hypothetical protein D9M68_326240 [compost metagenome]
MRTWLRRVPRWLPLLLVLLVLGFAGLRPEPVPEMVEQQDKLHHLLGFAALALSSRWAFPRLHLLWHAAACLGLALLIEAAQALEPLRSADPYDMLANAAGVLLGLLLSAGWMRRTVR